MPYFIELTETTANADGREGTIVLRTLSPPVNVAVRGDGNQQPKIPVVFSIVVAMKNVGDHVCLGIRGRRMPNSPKPSYRLDRYGLEKLSYFNACLEGCFESSSLEQSPYYDPVFGVQILPRQNRTDLAFSSA